MKKILITGSSGFIGQALIRRLERDHQLVGLDDRHGDIADPAYFEQAKGCGADGLIHLAGLVFPPRSWEIPDVYMRVNFNGTLHALEFCRDAKIPMVFLSSYLYGRPGRLPIAETDPLEAANPYALSKMMAEKLCEFYATNFDIPVTVFRPFNIYGAGQAGHFLIPKIIRQALQDPAIEVEDTEPRRDYLYIDDLTDAIALSLTRCRGYSVFNLGSGLSHSVGEIIALIQEIAGTDKPVIDRGNRRKNEIMDVVADVRQAKLLLGWEPSTSFRDGLERMIRQA